MPTPKAPLPIPSSAGFMVKMLFGFGFLLVLAYSALVALNPKAREWATSKNGPTPFKSVNQLLALPAQLVGKTKDVVATNDARVGVLDRVIAADAKGTSGVAGKPLNDPFGQPAATSGTSTARATAAAGGDDSNRVSREALLAMAAKDTPESPATQPVPVSTVAAEIPPAPGPAELKLPGGVVITNRSPEGTPPASAPFMYWAASLTVSGVSNASPARFLMNGRLVREGEEASKPLGITFEHVDPAAKLIYFRDKGGAVVTRSY
jgi:hypothetical protein